MANHRTTGIFRYFSNSPWRDIQLKTYNCKELRIGESWLGHTTHCQFSFSLKYLRTQWYLHRARTHTRIVMRVHVCVRGGCSCNYIHAYIHIYILTYVFTYVLMYVFTYVHIQTHPHSHAHACKHTRAYTHRCTQETRTRKCTHTHTHTRTHIHNLYICLFIYLSS